MSNTLSEVVIVQVNTNYTQQFITQTMSQDTTPLENEKKRAVENEKKRVVEEAQEVDEVASPSKKMKEAEIEDESIIAELSCPCDDKSRSIFVKFPNKEMLYEYNDTQFDMILGKITAALQKVYGDKTICLSDAIDLVTTKHPEGTAAQLEIAVDEVD
jgi:hypothetical protein